MAGMFSHATASRAIPESVIGKSLFGSSGIRGIVGQELNLCLCNEVARSVGTTLAPCSRVCVGSDTRVSREAIKNSVISGLRSSGIHITDLGILPTPTLAFLTKDMEFDIGVMITASHNPPEFNGIKLFNGNAISFSKAQEAEIEEVFHEKRFRSSSFGNLDRAHETRERYFQHVLSKLSRGNSNHALRIVIDPGNGAASRFARELFSEAGFDVIPLNDEPDGLFPGRKPEPTAETLESTIEFMRQQEAELAICFDGDADRVVFCDKEGFLGSDEVVAFVSRIAVEKSDKKKVVTTVEAGRLFEFALKNLGVEIVRGRVGDVCVAHLVQKLDAAIGVEPAGVYIMPEMGYYPEPFFAALTMISQIEVVGEIRRFFESMPHVFSCQSKVPCPNRLKPLVIEEFKVNSEPFGRGRLNSLDGLRFDFHDSWTLIRPSGTEPAIRVKAESTSMADAEVLLDTGVKAVETVLEELR